MTKPSVPPTIETQLLQLQRTVGELAAREALRERIMSSSRAMDRLDRDLYAAQFWPEAEVDYGVFYKGRIDGFLDVVMGFQGAMRDTQHLVGNIDIRLDGDHAAAESYVHAHHVLEKDGELVQLMVGARYLSRFEQRAGEWRISYQTEAMDWGRWLPIADKWFDENQEMPKGRRGREDLSYRFLQ